MKPTPHSSPALGAVGSLIAREVDRLRGVVFGRTSNTGAARGQCHFNSQVIARDPGRRHHDS